MCHLLSLALGVNGYYYYYCTAVAKEANEWQVQMGTKGGHVV